MVRDNALKARLRAGEKAIGAWLFSGDATFAEILAIAGYDGLVIDHEHAATTFRETTSALQALAATRCTGLARAPSHDPVYIKRLLDTGVEGVMIPSVDTPDQARAVVAACRFPPAGIRGNAAPIVRASEFGVSLDRYMAQVEREMLIICQIETPAAVEAIPDIAAVDGVDMLFVGPGDLSTAIGKPNQIDDAEVQALIRRAEREIKDTGLPLGCIPSLGRSAVETLADGADFVVSAADTALVLNGGRADVAAFRARTGG